MQLRTLLVRFYKSFNFDYERKATPGATPVPWEQTEAGWYPHVRVGLEPDITAVAGANESGKSHLLDAIEILLLGADQDARDFCRYSPLFSAERGLRRAPEIGGNFTLTDSERQVLLDENVPLRKDGTLLLLRPTPTEWDAVDGDDQPVPLLPAAIAAIQAMMPLPLRLKTNVPVPDSISIQLLAGKPGRSMSRRRRRSLLTTLSGFQSEQALSQSAPSLFSELASADTAAAGDELGRLLLTEVARIDPSAFEDLAQAIEEEKEGLVNGLIQTMNDSISRHLTLRRWWTQDADFTLRISPREHEVVFTIRDRTGTDYSFGERSLGLRYFLSYYIQLRSNERPADQPQILLMDEPDTYLSARGQQDLLRVLEHHVRPDGIVTDDQVVYVTHSPFLINRNAGHRIRVLDKGSGEEGTRVVKDASVNRYEPLRSSLGAYVAETAFIGGANLFVEGLSDQVLLAEMTSLLRRRGAPESETLDLNETTIVPAGSASSIPYMVYLARGQDEVKPPCAALLDSDQAGRDARAKLLRGGAQNKQLLPPEAIVMLGDWASAHVGALEVGDGVVVNEIEDLIPLPVAIAAARAYAERFLQIDVNKDALTAGDLSARIQGNGGRLFDALAEAFAAQFDTSLEKVGFAKEVIRYLRLPRSGSRPSGVPALEANFALLIAEVSGRLRGVAAAEDERRRSRRLSRTIDGFRRDHPDGCTRDRANTMLKEVESVAGETGHGDALRHQVSSIRRDFKLTTEPLTPVPEFAEFEERLAALEYVERLANRGEL